MGVDVMRAAINFEPKYRVAMLTGEEWTKVTGTPTVKGIVWFTDGSKMKEGNGAGVYGQSVRRSFSFSMERHFSVFQTETHAILVCNYEIKIL
jgi:hypothetical protein